MLGTLYRMMMLKQQSSLEKKIEVFSVLKPKISSENLNRLFIEKASALNAGFMSIVEKRIQSDIEELAAGNKYELYNHAISLESILKLIKMYLALTLYVHEEERGYTYFTKAIS